MFMATGFSRFAGIVPGKRLAAVAAGVAGQRVIDHDLAARRIEGPREVALRSRAVGSRIDGELRVVLDP